MVSLRAQTLTCLKKVFTVSEIGLKDSSVRSRSSLVKLSRLVGSTVELRRIKKSSIFLARRKLVPPPVRLVAVEMEEPATEAVSRLAAEPTGLTVAGGPPPGGAGLWSRASPGPPMPMMALIKSMAVQAKGMR